MFGLLGDGRPTVMSRTDKQQWKKDIERLIELRRSGTVGSVMDHLRTSKLRLPNAVQRREERIAKPEDDRQREAAERWKAAQHGSIPASCGTRTIP